MKQFLINCFSHLKPFLIKIKCCNVPNEIENNELIIRSIYSPYHYDEKRKRLKTAAFKNPKGGVSVLRLSFANANFCKKFSLKIHTNEKRFMGFAVLNVLQLIKNKFIIKAAKQFDACNHADIFSNYSVQNNDPAPTELNILLHNLIKEARFYKDPSPQIENWEGEELV